MRNKYAGVTLDFYDDKGATLKAKFPTPESLPDIIKIADVRPMEKLGNEDFALIALDEGHVLRKYACHDAGTTAMSVVYFMEHGDKLPENAQKLAAVNLVQACRRFDIRPPDLLVKTAGLVPELRNMIAGALGGGVGEAAINPDLNLRDLGISLAVGAATGLLPVPANTMMRALGGAMVPAVSHAAGNTMSGGEKRSTGTIGGGGAVGNPEKESQKLAAANLARACIRFDLDPPEALVKTAVSPEWVKGTVARWAPKATREAILSGPAALRRHTTRLMSAAEKHSPQAGAKHEALAHQLLGQWGVAKSYRHPKELAAARETLLARGFAPAKVAAAPSGGESQKQAADIIAGGKADKKTSSDFSPKQMEMGKKVEKEHTNNPQVAAEVARDHLEEIPDYYTRLDKMENEAKQANVVDITGKRPTPKVKVAKASGPEDYAVILDGKGYYPIHTWDLVKKAEVYYQEEKGRMQPEVRRQYAVKLADKAASMGYPLDPDVLEAGATSWAPKGHLKAAVEMRKIACQPGTGDRKFLDELFEKRASIDPPTYAEVLRRFDVEHGLDKGWDHVILDPWASTFGLNKTADVVWEDGADRVTNDQLMFLSQNHAAFNRDFTEEFRKEFQKDPVSIFESLPLPQKRIIARLAADFPHQSEITQSR